MVGGQAPRCGWAAGKRGLRDKTKAEILCALADGRPHAAQEIVARRKLSGGAVQGCLRRLRQRGYIWRSESMQPLPWRGVGFTWHIVSKGYRWLVSAADRGLVLLDEAQRESFEGLAMSLEAKQALEDAAARAGPVGGRPGPAALGGWVRASAHPAAASPSASAPTVGRRGSPVPAAVKAPAGRWSIMLDRRD